MECVIKWQLTIFQRLDVLHDVNLGEFLARNIVKRVTQLAGARINSIPVSGYFFFLGWTEPLPASRQMQG